MSALIAESVRAYRAKPEVRSKYSEIGLRRAAQPGFPLTDPKVRALAAQRQRSPEAREKMRVGPSSTAAFIAGSAARRRGLVRVEMADGSTAWECRSVARCERRIVGAA